MLFSREETSEADFASWRLAVDVVVDWCPGDATRYQLALIERPGVRWLVLLNLGGRVFELPNYRRGPEDWMREGIPGGAWPGLRPLLAQLGVAHGPERYRPTTPYVEADDVPEDWWGQNDIEVERRARAAIVSAAR